MDKFVIQTSELAKRFSVSKGYVQLLMPKRRSFKTALDRVDLQVEQGEIYGLLGANGAGKTTLMKILATLVMPDEGQARVQGFDVVHQARQVKQVLSYVISDDRSFYWRLTGKQNMRFFAVLNDVPRREVDNQIDKLLSLVGLNGSENDRVMSYSSGMRQRLAIARGLISNPSVLLLDEPTKSLDPVGASNLWTFVKDELVRQRGTTVLLATHNMEEARFLCDRVAIIAQGKFVASDTVQALGSVLSGAPVRYTIAVSDIPSQLIAEVCSMQRAEIVSVVEPNGHKESTIELLLDDPTVQIPDIVHQLVDAGGRVAEVSRGQGSLTDLVNKMIGTST